MIKQAEFVKSATHIDHMPHDGKPHILLLGRSNVGKSSFINAVCNRKALARVSQTPGKTITLNLYKLDDFMYLVDAPGYGYARRSFETQAEFIKMIFHYVKEEANLSKIFLLVDFKVGPTKDDLEIYHQLTTLDREVVVVATKFDKVKSSMRDKQKKLIIAKFIDGQKIYFISNETKYGIEKVQSEIETLRGF